MATWRTRTRAARRCRCWRVGTLISVLLPSQVFFALRRVAANARAGEMCHCALTLTVRQPMCGGRHALGCSIPCGINPIRCSSAQVREDAGQRARPHEPVHEQGLVLAQYRPPFKAQEIFSVFGAFGRPRFFGGRPVISCWFSKISLSQIRPQCTEHRDAVGRSKAQ